MVLISETTGEEIHLLSMAPPDQWEESGSHPGENTRPPLILAFHPHADPRLSPPPPLRSENGRSSSLLCGDVCLPDVFSLRVDHGSGQYTQCNWREPFEITYLGPMLMTLEVQLTFSFLSFAF